MLKFTHIISLLKLLKKYYQYILLFILLLIILIFVNIYYNYCYLQKYDFKKIKCKVIQVYQKEVPYTHFFITRPSYISKILVEFYHNNKIIQLYYKRNIHYKINIGDFIDLYYDEKKHKLVNYTYNMKLTVIGIILLLVILFTVLNMIIISNNYSEDLNNDNNIKRVTFSENIIKE